MSQPQRYKRTKNFIENAGDATDHSALNTEFDNIASTTDQIRANLALLQNDSGTIRKSAITEDSLSDDLKEFLKGDKGDTGEQGPQGEKGDTGATGEKGEKGDTGASFDADARGLSSAKDLYDTRAAGFSFLDISTGKLYFKLSDTSGDWSDPFTFGKGETGATGPQGPRGEKGEQGERGPKGDTGEKGATGEKGDDGAVTEVDTAIKSLSIVGKRTLTVRLIISNGKLSLELGGS